MKPTLYVSIDIEADGPIPGRNSMLSLGAVSITPEGNEIAAFSVNLSQLPGAVQDYDTMAFWSKNPDAYAATRERLMPPEDGISLFQSYLCHLKESFSPVFMAFPSSYDFMWVHWYLNEYGGGNPLGHSCLCLKTLAMSLLGCEFRNAAKRNFPKRWFSDQKHTHVALEDAREQALMGVKMLGELRQKSAA